MTIELKLSKKLQCLENIPITNTEKEGMFVIIAIKSFMRKLLLSPDTIG